jgi:thiamine-phosphate diphosphorylase
LPAARKQPVICYVTERYATERHVIDRTLLRSPNPDATLLKNISAAIEAGVDWIQLREKDMAARQLLELARATIDIATREIANGDIAKRDIANDIATLDIAKCEAEPAQHTSGERNGAGARVIVNDRLDVALAVGAAGVHLGGDSASVVDVARWCLAGNAPAGFSIGVSCHSIEESRQAEERGADHVIFGPVFDTPSKRPFGASQGISRLAEVCSALKIPVIAIGGINEETAMQCVRAGAAGVAAIRLFQENGEAKLREILARIHEGV